MSDPVGIPVLVAIEVEQTTAVNLVVARPTAIPSLPIISYNLYSGPTPSGPWVLVGNTPIAEISAYKNLFDTQPKFGHTTYYTATAIRSDGVESAMATPLAITPLSQ